MSVKGLKIGFISLRYPKLPKTLLGKERELRSLYRSNITCKEIARILNVGESTLTKAISLLGLKRKPRYQRKGYNLPLLRELEALGLSHVEIAARLGVHVSTLKKIYQYYGLTYSIPQSSEFVQKRVKSRKDNKENGTRPLCPNQTNVLEPYADKIIELLNTGVSKSEIARRYGVCPGTVFNFIYLNQLKAPVIRKCDNIERIKTAYSHGATQKEIAQDLNCSTKLVSQRLKDLKLKRSQALVKRDSSLKRQENLIRELYLQGLSGWEIAEKVHAHPGSIYQKLKKMNLSRPIKVAEYKSAFKGKKETLLNMWHNGMSINDLAKYFGVHRNTISYHLKRLGA